VSHLACSAIVQMTTILYSIHGIAYIVNQPLLVPNSMSFTDHFSVSLTPSAPAMTTSTMSGNRTWSTMPVSLLMPVQLHRGPSAAIKSTDLQCSSGCQ